MTYPPQGPYGQQPDPYGQQQPQYTGGFQQPQQQQPQYGGYDPNTQQYGGGYGQQYGGLGGGEPPKSNKGPIIAVVSIVVLILAGVGVTGFVAPGFFLSDDKGNSNAGSGSKSSTEKKDDGAGGADPFIQKLVKAADDKDKTTLKELTCSDASDSVSGATNDIDEIDSAELKDTREVSDTEVVATLNIVVNGKDGDYEATVVKDGAKWCWSDISSGSGGGSSEEPTSSDETATSDDIPSPTSGGSPGDSEGGTYVQGFLDKMNAGDAAGASAMVCPESADNKADITEAVGQGAQMQVDPNGSNSADSQSAGIDLIGTLNGAPASGRVSAFTDDAGNFCIYTFFFYED